MSQIAHPRTTSPDPAFFAELGAADIIVSNKRVGVIGVVHPEVLANYELRIPCGEEHTELIEFISGMFFFIHVFVDSSPT